MLKTRAGDIIGTLPIGISAHENEKFLPARAVQDRYSVTDMSIRRRVAKGTFPKPVQIGKRNYWRLSDLIAFERSLIAER